MTSTNLIPVAVSVDAEKGREDMTEGGRTKGCEKQAAHTTEAMRK
jgi:hypothetical protein